MNGRQDTHSAARAELERVLESGVFARAPSLALLLRTICERHFAGESQLTTEHRLALEALGRPADFDQKRDSIVRVEMHRLRKRLKEYYAGVGADHAVQIELPLGTYVPLFRQVQSPPNEPETPAPNDAAGWRRSLNWAGAAALLLLLAAGAWLGFDRLHSARDHTTPADPAQKSQPVADRAIAAAQVSEVRIDAGSTVPYTDAEGHTWVSDRYFEGGQAASDEALEASGTLQPRLFKTWRQGGFGYRIPLKPGPYELTLWFCEPVLKARPSDSRLFSIWINGRRAVNNFDVLTESGAANAVMARVWKDIRPGSDGFLWLEFRPLSGAALLMALELTPGTPGRMRPLRITAREEPYSDSAGRLWLSDRYFSAGRLAKRSEQIRGTEDPELYRGERYGRLTYSIPVPPEGSYTAVLHMAETWWGSGGRPGPGLRVFDILLNGLRLEQNVDVLVQAGGPLRALQKTYHGLRPDSEGRLVFQLVPSRNWAFLNAIEILDESPAAP